VLKFPRVAGKPNKLFWAFPRDTGGFTKAVGACSDGGGRFVQKVFNTKKVGTRHALPPTGIWYLNPGASYVTFRFIYLIHHFFKK
jgi:hypothetical protein